MGAVETTGAANDRHEPEAIDDRTIQATSVAVVAASLVVWWPAFDLGAYGVIFFQQLLSLWAASTAVFRVSLTAGRRARLSWPRRLALLLPSLWLLLALAVPEGGAKAWSRALFYLAILLTMAGTPYLASLLLRVTIAGYAQIPNRRRLLAAGIVAVVAIASFGLGKFNDRFLTCHEFVISGNDTPPSCNPGRGHLGRPLAQLLGTMILGRKPLQGVSPFSCAYAAAAVRDGTFSLVKILLRCRSTVF